MAPATKKSKDAEKEPKGKKSSKAGKEKRVSKPSAYLHFGKVMRPKLKEDEPDLPQKEYMSRIGELWRDLSDKEKKKYEAMRDKEWEASGGPAKLAAYKEKQAEEKGSGKATKKAAKKPAAKKKKAKEEEPEDEDDEEEGDSPAEEAAGDDDDGDDDAGAADDSE